MQQSQLSAMERPLRLRLITLPPWLASMSIRIGGAIIGLTLVAAILAPLFASHDPILIDPLLRLRPPSQTHWFGTDLYGRDIYSRVFYGARSSLGVGISVAAISVVIGLPLGLAAGYLRAVDVVIMRIMDGVMAIPTFLLAIALVSLSRATFWTVVTALIVPEIPRVVRLARGVVLSAREEPYVEAASTLGTPTYLIVIRHILPNTLAPLTVLATYIMAAAILIESGLSFLGAGLPPEMPSWGNMIAEGRAYFRVAPWIVFLPSLFLGVTVLGINILGDGLRDMLDPRIAKRM